MTIQCPRDQNTPVSHLPFCPATRVGDLIFGSGQASVDDKGNIIRDTFEGEFRRALENLRKLLVAAGSELQHVVQTRNYVRVPANVARYNELYREFFTVPYPARMTLTHCLPEVLHFEIECIAVPK